MSGVHFRLNLGEDNGKVEVDLFEQSGHIYLEAVDTSHVNDQSTHAVVLLTPDQAREVARSLLEAAEKHG